MTEVKKAVAYIRKSTSGTGENGVERQEGSFDRQRAAIEDYAKRKEITITKWYEDEASGKTLRKREKFREMVRDAEAGKFKMIIFGEYDRFMRNVHEAMRYEVLFEDLGVELNFTNLSNDGGEEDHIIKSVVRSMAARYSIDLATRCLQGMIQKAEKGSWLGGIPPYGYRSERCPDGRVELIIHEEEAKAVRMIFEYSLAGWGHKRIAAWLNDNGVPSSETARSRNSLSNWNPDGKWSGNAVRAVLRNSIYKGLFRWNKAERVDCFDWEREGKGTVKVGKFRIKLDRFKKLNGFYVDRIKPEEKWIKKPNAVPAIVSAETFERVQDRFRPYASRNWHRGNNVRYLMAKGLRCANCGNNCNGHRYGKFLEGAKEKAFYEYYRCSGDVRKGSHGKAARPMVRREAIDDVVTEGILRRAGTLMDLSRVKELFRNRLREYLDSRPNRLAQVEQEMERVEKEIERTIEAYARFGKPIPEERRLDLIDRKRILEAERDSLVAAGETSFSFDVDQEVENFLSGIRDVKEVLNAGLPVDRIRLRERFLKSAEIKWFPDRIPEVKLYWYKIPKTHISEGPTIFGLTKEGPAPGLI